MNIYWTLIFIFPWIGASIGAYFHYSNPFGCAFMATVVLTILFLSIE